MSALTSLVNFNSLMSELKQSPSLVVGLAQPYFHGACRGLGQPYSSQSLTRAYVIEKTHLCRFSWVEVSGLPRGALVEWHIVAGLPDAADSETADGESGVKRAGGVGEDNPWEMDDVISELRYDKSKLRGLMLTCLTETPS